MSLKQKKDKVLQENAKQLKIKIRELELKDKYTGSKMAFNIDKDKYIVVFKCNNKKEIQHALKQITEEKITYYKIYSSSNPRNIDFKIAYNPESKIEIWVEFKPDIIKDIIDEFCFHTKRKLYETEYHYFSGCGYQKLKNIKISRIQFKDNHENYYGGTSVLTDVTTTNKFVEKLKGGNNEKNN